MSNEYKQTLARFEQAVRDHEGMGAQHPADWPAIEKEYNEAKDRLVRKLTYRTAKPMQGCPYCNNSTVF